MFAYLVGVDHGVVVGGPIKVLNQTLHHKNNARHDPSSKQFHLDDSTVASNTKHHCRASLSHLILQTNNREGK